MPRKNRRVANGPLRTRQRARRGLLVACAFALGASACGSTATSLSNAAQHQRDALIEKGIGAQRAGDATKAAADYEAALVIDKTSATAHYDLGDVQQLDLGEGAAAISNYKMALSVEPMLASALFNLAILETAHDPKAAASAYRRLIALDSSDAPARWNLGYVLVSAGKTKAGIAEIARALQLDPALSSRAGSTPRG